MLVALAALVTGVCVALTTSTANHSRDASVVWVVVAAIIVATGAVLFSVLKRRG